MRYSVDMKDYIWIPSLIVSPYYIMNVLHHIQIRKSFIVIFLNVGELYYGYTPNFGPFVTNTSSIGHIKFRVNFIEISVDNLAEFKTTVISES